MNSVRGTPHGGTKAVFFQSVVSGLSAAAPDIRGGVPFAECLVRGWPSVEVPSCEEMILREGVEISLDIFYHYSMDFLYSGLSFNPGNTRPLTEETDYV